MKIQKLFIVFLAIAGCHQIIPQNSIHSMKHGKFKDQLPFEQQKIIDQHFSTFKTTGQAFEHGDQGLGNRIGTYSAKSKVDKISGPVTPPVIPAVATITFIDKMELNAGEFKKMTTTTNPQVSDGTVTITANAGFTGMSGTIDGPGTLTQTTSGVLNSITIDGNIVITDQLKLVTCDVTINGDLTVNAHDDSGIPTAGFDDYIDIGTGSSLTVAGDILFDGKNSHNIKISGDIEATGSGIIMMQNNLWPASGALVAIFVNNGTIKSDSGAITLENNGIDYDLFNYYDISTNYSTTYAIACAGPNFELSSTSGAITFKNNGAYYPMIIAPSSGLVKTSGNILCEKTIGISYIDLEETIIEAVGSGAITFKDNNSFSQTPLILIGTNSTITSSDGDILFDVNNQYDGYLIDVGGELKTTGAGSIVFQNNLTRTFFLRNLNDLKTTGSGSIQFLNNNIKQENLIDNFGLISSASTITFENNCTSCEHEILNKGSISAVGSITLTNDSLYNDITLGTPASITDSTGTIPRTGTAIPGVFETAPLENGDVTFTGDLVIDGNNHFTIPLTTTLDADTSKGVVIKAGGTITDNLGNSRVVTESNDTVCFADKVSIAADVTIEGSLKLEGTAYLYIAGDLVINGTGSEAFSLDIGPDATLDVLENITIDGKNSKSCINAGTIKSNSTPLGQTIIKDHTSNSTHAALLSGANALIKARSIIFEGNISLADNMDGVRIDHALGKVEAVSSGVKFKDNSSTGGTPGFGVNNFGTISTFNELRTCGLSPTGTNSGTATDGNSRDIQNQGGATISYDFWVDCT